MALSIVNNSTAIGAQGSVNKANNSLAKTIKSLSTGLRINTAADDASGLAVSEKLRGQISGLNKAALNAQDAISMLQTAEGAMGSMTSMVQRIRELAVQAGDPAYTANDRAMLQLEVDQLKEEINRVSSSTEFNTKKLLNGDAAGLWSATSNDVEAILRGTPAQGNYQIDYALAGGVNNVYKTNVMTAESAKLSRVDYTFQGASLAGMDGTFAGEGTITLTAQDQLANQSATIFENTTGLADADLVMSGGNTLFKENNNYAVTVEFLSDIKNGTGAAFQGGQAKVTYIDLSTGVEKTEVMQIMSADGAGGHINIGGTQGDQTGNIVLKLATDGEIKKGAKLAMVYQHSVAANATIAKLDTKVMNNGKEMDLKISHGINGVGSNEMYVASYENGRFKADLLKFNFAASGSATFNGKQINSTKSVADILGNPGITGRIEYRTESDLKEPGKGVGNAPNAISAALTLLGSKSDAGITGIINTGGSTLASIDGTYAINIELLEKAAGGAAADTPLFKVKLTATNLETGEETVKEVNLVSSGTLNKFNIGGTKNDGSDAFVSFTATDISKLAKGDSMGFVIGGDNKKDNNLKITLDQGYSIYTKGNEGEKTTVHAAKFEDGKIKLESLTIKLKDKTESGMIKFDTTREERVAGEDTLLKDLKVFKNSDGRNVLDNTQELTLYNNKGDKKSIFLEGNDTVKDLQDKLTQAMIDLGLGAKTDDPVLNKEINDNLVKFVNEGEQEKGNTAVPGTFIIQGASVGDDSKISFVGDQNVLNALSLTNIKQGQNAYLDVTVKDAHTGSDSGNKVLYSGKVGADEISDGILRGVINGVDIKINTGSGSRVSLDQNGDIQFNKDADGKSISVKNTEYLHIVDNSTKAAIGSNEGQVLDLSIGRLDTASLEIDDVNVATFENAQKSITKLDMALERISKARATTGAQMNRLEYTIENLNTTRENMVAAESRIRDLDIASTSSQLASQQVILQSATAMLAQANQLPSYAMQLLG